jgi:hypothetical protein
MKNKIRKIKTEYILAVIFFILGTQIVKIVKFLFRLSQ